MKRMICHLAASESASHCSGGEPAALGKGVPSKEVGHGKAIPLDCTMYPTKAAMATRPCLISAWRRNPMVASLVSPQMVVDAS